MKNKRITAYLLLLFVSVIWGVASPIIKNTLNYLSPTVFLTYRFFLSTVVGLLYFSFHPETIPNTRYQVTHTMTHSIGVIIFGLGLLFFGFNYTDSLTGNLLASTGPVFSILLGAIILHEKVSRQEMVGLALAIGGSIMIVLTGDGAAVGGFLGIAMIGNGFILISRLADAIGGVSTKQALNHGMNPTALTHIAFIVGFLFFAVLTITRLGGVGPLISTIVAAPLAAHLGVIYMSLISGTFGYYLANHALRSIELGEASIFSYLTVVWGTPISVLWLGDKLTPQIAIGATIIAIGVTIAEWKRRSKKKLTTRRHT